MGKKRKQQLAVARTKRFKNGWILYFISYLYHSLFGDKVTEETSEGSTDGAIEVRIKT